MCGVKEDNDDDESSKSLVWSGDGDNKKEE
jgi:hypothetical protein